jgi:hypothetical protein
MLLFLILIILFIDILFIIYIMFCYFIILSISASNSLILSSTISIIYLTSELQWLTICITYLINKIDKQYIIYNYIFTIQYISYYGLLKWVSYNTIIPIISIISIIITNLIFIIIISYIKYSFSPSISIYSNITYLGSYLSLLFDNLVKICYFIILYNTIMIINIFDNKSMTIVIGTYILTLSIQPNIIIISINKYISYINIYILFYYLLINKSITKSM